MVDGGRWHVRTKDVGTGKFLRADSVDSARTDTGLVRPAIVPPLRGCVDERRRERGDGDRGRTEDGQNLRDTERTGDGQDLGETGRGREDWEVVEDNALSPDVATGDSDRDGQDSVGGGQDSRGQEQREESSGGDGLSDREEEGEEGREARGLRAPVKVTKEMREEHNKTHCPYRSWCKHCVEGRGMNMPHKNKAHDDKDKEIQAVPRVSMDYFYMSQADEEANESPCLVMETRRLGRSMPGPWDRREWERTERWTGW